MWAQYHSLVFSLSLWMDLSGGQVSCQACTCLSSLTLYPELCAGSCVGHMPHSPTPPTHEPTGRQPQKKSHGDGRREEGLFLFLLHLVLIVWIPYKSLSLILSVSRSLLLCSLLQEAFFLHTWIPVGVCNSKHLLGKMLVAAPSPHGLTGPIPPALRPEEYCHMTSNILICGLGCILWNRKLFFVVLFYSFTNQQIYFTFRHFWLRHFHFCSWFYGGHMAEI